LIGDGWSWWKGNKVFSEFDYNLYNFANNINAGLDCVVIYLENSTIIRFNYVSCDQMNYFLCSYSESDFSVENLLKV